MEHWSVRREPIRRDRLRRSHGNQVPGVGRNPGRIPGFPGWLPGRRDSDGRDPAGPLGSSEISWVALGSTSGALGRLWRPSAIPRGPTGMVWGPSRTFEAFGIPWGFSGGPLGVFWKQQKHCVLRAFRQTVQKDCVLRTFRPTLQKTLCFTRCPPTQKKRLFTCFSPNLAKQTQCFACFSPNLAKNTVFYVRFAQHCKKHCVLAAVRPTFQETL